MSGRGLVERLAAEGLEASPWSNGPGEAYAAHGHGYDKVLAVATGSIVFGVPGAGSFELAEGDRLELPAGTVHDALVGASGVTCLEAHLRPGSLRELRRRPAGSW